MTEDDDDDDGLWDNVVHDFSLASIGPPNGDSLPQRHTSIPVPSADIPPDTAPTEAIETASGVKIVAPEVVDDAPRVTLDVGDARLAAEDWYGSLPLKVHAANFESIRPFTGLTFYHRMSLSTSPL